MKSPNRLGHKGNFALVTWLQQNLPRFKTEHPSDKAVAEQATKALGFEVRRGNVRGVRTEFGFDWSRPKSPKSVNRETSRQDLIGLAECLKDLTNIVRAIMPDDHPELPRLSELYASIGRFAGKLSDPAVNGTGNLSLFQS